MQAGTDRFTSFDKLELRFQWQRPANPKVGVVIVHGVADHMNRYQALCAFLADHDYATYSYDQRGHGHSRGLRTDVQHFMDYAKDLDEFIRHVRRREPRLPLFVFSHSMGTLVAIHTLIKDSLGIKGLIISAYPCKLTSPVPFWQRIVCHVAARLYPTWRVSSGIKPTQLSHDPRVIKDYKEDSLVGRNVTMRWVSEFLKACKSLEGSVTELRMPVLVLHGESDEIAASAGARALIESVSCQDKTIKTYSGLKHELHNEIIPGREEYLADIRHWLDAHV